MKNCAGGTRFESLVGKNQRMQEVYDLILQVAPVSTTVLIQGESGTGKELIAQAIHQRSFSWACDENTNVARAVSAWCAIRNRICVSLACRVEPRCLVAVRPNRGDCAGKIRIASRGRSGAGRFSNAWHG